jgi:hypothetical protein
MLGAISLVLTAAQVGPCMPTGCAAARAGPIARMAPSLQPFHAGAAQAAPQLRRHSPSAAAAATPRPAPLRAAAGPAAPRLRCRRQLLLLLLPQAPAAGLAGRRPELLRARAGAAVERRHHVRHPHPAVPGGSHPHRLHHHHHDRLPLEGGLARCRGTQRSRRARARPCWWGGWHVPRGAGAPGAPLGAAALPLIGTAAAPPLAAHRSGAGRCGRTKRAPSARCSGSTAGGRLLAARPPAPGPPACCRCRTACPLQTPERGAGCGAGAELAPCPCPLPPAPCSLQDLPPPGAQPAAARLARCGRPVH